MDTNTYLTGITSGQVTGALGYTPYNSSNPSGYVTSSNWAILSGATSYNTDRTTKVSNGLAIYSAYSGGANSPTTYDISAQYVVAGKGMEMAASWHSPSATMFFRTLRDCCDNWSSWVTMLSSANFNSYALPLTGGTLSGNLYVTNSSTVGAIFLSGAQSGARQYMIQNGITGISNSGLQIRDVTGNASLVYFDTSYNASFGAGIWATSGNFSAAISASNISSGVNASHIVQRDGNGYIYANHINFNTPESENPAISSFITSNGDGWSRKSSLAHVRNQLGNYGGWITSSGSISGNAATTSQRSFSGDISTDGMGRFTGWYTGTAATTLATEVGVSSGLGYIIVYNRQTGTYGTLNLNAVNINIDPQGGTASVSGSQIVTNNGGTWSISITGNAGSVSGLTLNSINSAINPNNVTQNQIGYNTSVNLFGQTDGGLYSSAYSSDWIHQIYGDFRSGQIAIRGKQAGTWQAWRTVLDSGNYNSYSPTLTGGNASGTWGISITGNAQSSTTTTHLSSRTDGAWYNVIWGAGSPSYLYSSDSVRILSSEGALRANIYYDNQDTAYYLNPAGGSRLRNLYVGDSGDDWSDPGGWGTQVRFSNIPHVRFVLHARSPGIEAGMYVHTPGSVFIGSYTGHDVSMMWAGNRKMLITNSYVYTDVYLEAAGSMRAPIFYDSDDTGYYADFNSTGNTAMRVRGGTLYGPNPTWGAYLQVGGNGNQNTAYASVVATNGNLHLDSAAGYAMYLNNYANGIIYLNGGTYYISSNGSYYNGRSEQVTINYNNDSNSTYQLLWGSGNSVYGTAQVYVNPSSDIIYARGGYISPGNAWGTGDSAFFPNGITTAGGTNWVYGTTYIGNAPGNGAGHEFFASGSSNSTGDVSAYGSLRAPIFYDRNDTSYYLDPNSNSNLWKFTAGTMARNDMNPLSVNSPWSTRASQAGPYVNGTMGWGQVDLNTVGSYWGSGFIDTWSSPGNAPGGSSHYVGIQSMHYNDQNGNFHGWQMVCAQEATNRWFLRSSWNVPNRPWVEMIHGGNIGSQSVSYANSAGSASSASTAGFASESYIVRSTNDFRHVNRSPNDWHGLANSWHFNDRGTVGLSSSDYWVSILTVNPWSSYDGSHRQQQLAFGGTGGLSFRYATGPSSWSGWETMITTASIGNQSVSYANNAGNVSSISGALNGNHTWTNINYFLTNNGGYLGSTDSAKLQVYSYSNNSAFMSFHKSSHYAVNFGLDADNVMRIGGWSASANRWQLDMSGNMTVAGDVTAYSDARVKENVETIVQALDKVLQLRGVSYNRTDSDDKKTKIGVIAQETLVVVPEVVNQDNAGMYNVSYGNLAGLFIEAFKEQQKQIEDLKSKLDALTK
jgi:hypothetical protein